MKVSLQQKLTSPRLSKSRAVDPTRRSFILQSMDSVIGFDEDDDSLSMGDLNDVPHPAVTKPSIRKPGLLTKDDRSTSTEVTAGLDDCSVTSVDIAEMDKPFSILPVSPYGEVLDFQEHYEDDEEDQDSSINSTESLNVIEKPTLIKAISIESVEHIEGFLAMPDLKNMIEKPNLRKAVSIESVDIDDFLGMPDLRKSLPPLRRTSIAVPLPQEEVESPCRRSSVSFAALAEVSFIDKLDAKTDYDSLYYTDVELADFRHEAFLEQCGLAGEKFD